MAVGAYKPTSRDRMARLLRRSGLAELFLHVVRTARSVMTRVAEFLGRLAAWEQQLRARIEVAVSFGVLIADGVDHVARGTSIGDLTVPAVGGFAGKTRVSHDGHRRRGARRGHAAGHINAPDVERVGGALNQPQQPIRRTRYRDNEGAVRCVANLVVRDSGSCVCSRRPVEVRGTHRSRRRGQARRGGGRDRVD